ncbi:MAG TPA: hypothetical protein VD928_03280 [Candidatus Paceibacterota bacterium]|nr:hypothetical protein [Candidatus Paceibacterota bacterium]
MHIKIENVRIGNGAGSVKALAEMERLCQSPVVTDITVGSITRLQRDGNDGNTVRFDPYSRTSLNALGLVNRGLPYYKDAMPYMVALAHQHGKRLIASVAGTQLEEFAELTETMFSAHVDVVELNLGCPHLFDEKGLYKKPISYDPRMCETILAGMRSNIEGTSKKLSVKISPVGDDILPELAAVLIASKIVSEVVAVNTLPNQTLYNPDGTTWLYYHPPGQPEVTLHTGGLGGLPLLERSLEIVEFLRMKCPANMEICGIGGIYGGEQAIEYIKRGASRIASTSGCMLYGPGIFYQIMDELHDLLEEAKQKDLELAEASMPGA